MILRYKRKEFSYMISYTFGQKRIQKLGQKLGQKRAQKKKEESLLKHIYQLSDVNHKVMYDVIYSNDSM